MVKFELEQYKKETSTFSVSSLYYLLKNKNKIKILEVMVKIIFLYKIFRST